MIFLLILINHQKSIKMCLFDFHKEKKIITWIIRFLIFFYWLFLFCFINQYYFINWVVNNRYKKNISRYAKISRIFYTHVHLLIGIMSPLSIVHQNKYKLPLTFTNGKVFINRDFLILWGRHCIFCFLSCDYIIYLFLI